VVANRTEAQVAARADRIVAEGRAQPAAHDQREAARRTLLAARDRMNMPYYLDGLTCSHDWIEAIRLAARGKDATTLDDVVVAVLGAGFGAFGGFGPVRVK
jgi:hypothetical protein